MPNVGVYAIFGFAEFVTIRSSIQFGHQCLSDGVSLPTSILKKHRNVLRVLAVHVTHRTLRLEESSGCLVEYEVLTHEGSPRSNVPAPQALSDL